jgi:hypothetical protein
MKADSGREQEDEGQEIQMPFRKRLSRSIWLAGLLAVALIVAIPQIAGATPNPPGNNGTVKIHDGSQDVSLDSNPHNQPHVGCPFTVTFFGFDEGDVAKVTFTAWSPTGKGKVLLGPDTVDIGADDNSGGGSPAGFDGAKTYALDFDGIVPHEKQGFHVKLTVTVTSPGSKTPKFNKYKVFWAQPCKEESTTTTTTGSGGMLPTSSAGGGGASATTGQGALPFTGSNSLPVALAGLLLLLVGGGAVLASRRMRTR